MDCDLAVGGSTLKSGKTRLLILAISQNYLPEPLRLTSCLRSLPQWFLFLFIIVYAGFVNHKFRTIFFYLTWNLTTKLKWGLELGGVVFVSRMKQFQVNCSIKSSFCMYSSH